MNNTYRITVIKAVSCQCPSALLLSHSLSSLPPFFDLFWGTIFVGVESGGWIITIFLKKMLFLTAGTITQSWLDPRTKQGATHLIVIWDLGCFYLRYYLFQSSYTPNRFGMMHCAAPLTSHQPLLSTVDQWHNQKEREIPAFTGPTLQDKVSTS